MRRPPDRIIGDTYLHRWYLIPRNRFFNIYLHKFLGSDDDRALHDHPWHSLSFLLKGCLVEWYEEAEYNQLWRTWIIRNRDKIVPRLVPVFRTARYSHRLELASKEPAWTLFITGPAFRQWGFWCGDRWVHWKEFTDESGDRVGRGCE